MLAVIKNEFPNRKVMTVQRRTSWNWSNGYSSKSKWEKWGCLSRSHVYYWSYDHQNVRGGSFFLFSADDSNKLVTVSEKYSSTHERSKWIILEYGMTNKFWSYFSWVAESRNSKKSGWVNKNYQNLVRVYILLMVAKSPIIHSIF